MKGYHTKDKQELLHQLKNMFHQRLVGEQAQKVSAFTDQHYLFSTLEDLESQTIEDLYGATLSCWKFIQKGTRLKPKIRVFNPDIKKDGWSSKHTIIEILNIDTPFIVDSVYMELSRQNLSVYTVRNTVISVERDSKGKMTELKSSHHEPGRHESLIYLEIDRLRDPAVRAQLEKDISVVLDEVYAAVKDFGLMTAKAKALIGHLEKPSNTPSTAFSTKSLQEAQDFLKWMLNKHFVFLGYSRRDNHNSVQINKRHSLGVIRIQPDCESFEATVGEETRSCISFRKHTARSRVHRPAYLDQIIICEPNADGSIGAEHCFYGLYTSSAFRETPQSIPVVRDKVETVMKRTGFDTESYSHKEMVQIFNEMPREELILSSTKELFHTTIGIYNLQRRGKPGIFLRRDSLGHFISCLYYAPRDVYNTNLRLKVQEALTEEFKSEDSEATVYLSESSLARSHFVFRLASDNKKRFNTKQIESKVLEISRSWESELKHSLLAHCADEGSHLAELYQGAFTESYKEHFSPANATYDVQKLSILSESNPIELGIYQQPGDKEKTLRLKLYTEHERLILSEVLPILENFNMQVLGEHPFSARCKNQKVYWIHDFKVRTHATRSIDTDTLYHLLKDGFQSVLDGHAGNDEFNHLLLTASISWRDIAMLRAYARYMRQIRLGFSQPYIAEVLSKYSHITKQLVDFFHMRLNPVKVGKKVSGLTPKQFEAELLASLNQVEALDEDKILRGYMELIQATLRTNFFQEHNWDNTRETYFSFKMQPSRISGIPKPCPMFEIFVYSPRIEGVHLRYGEVARGGLRWSDRYEDYRTEVLGLVKAQQVKNSVIVPAGAKGCFVAKQLPENASREDIQKEGIACYQLFIKGLLDVSDNLVSGKIVPPKNVVRLDKDDPYLVVAADKGTATFSDIANALSDEYGFWLGDAFASGGSQGYDHKGMGITARGAWESVKRLFREKGIDTQSDEFSVVAIGDMAGDVFGNGMLLSDKIQLVVAFNHMHIFIDPTPCTASSFKERKRLFELPRSSWADYNEKLISKGGGIYLRSSKSIELSTEARKALGISKKSMTPTELIQSALKSPVDMIWNGGIGTYVKASSESHLDIGDKANNEVRVNGAELRCKVLGEGGNLGFSQLGRIEFCQNGGACNTDFIDNAGGVDCSDHEVNIKILLNQLVLQGELSMSQRNRLLKSMTDDVADLVIRNNYSQVQAISIAEEHARANLDDYIQLITHLESRGMLDRTLEAMPSDEELDERKQQGQGLTRPELSVLISLTKIELKQALIHSWVVDDPYLSTEVEAAFPARLVKKYKKQTCEHQLRREIIANQLANSLINRMGITFVHNTHRTTGRAYPQIAAAYFIAQGIFNIDNRWNGIESLDSTLTTTTQVEMMRELIQLSTRATHWLLKNYPLRLDTTECIANYQSQVTAVAKSAASLKKIIPNVRWQKKHEALCKQGVPEALANYIAAAGSLYWVLDIIDISNQTKRPLKQVADIYFTIGKQLHLIWFDRVIKDYRPTTNWQSLAKSSYRNGVDSHQKEMTLSVIRTSSSTKSADSAIAKWAGDRQSLIQRWELMLSDLRETKSIDCAILSVAMGVLFDLV